MSLHEDIQRLHEEGEFPVHGYTLTDLIQIVSALGINLDKAWISETYNGARLKIK